MISSFLALVIQATTANQPTIIELPNEKDNRVVVQAVIRIPEGLGSRSRTRLECAVTSLSMGTIGYPRHKLVEFAGLAGQGLRISLSDQYLAIGVTAPKSSADIAADLIAELLQKPLFPEADVQKILEELPFRRYTSAELVFDDRGFDFNKLTRDEVIDEYKKLVIPSNTTVIVAGAFTPGSGREELENRLISWPTLAPVRYAPIQKEVAPRKATTGSFGTTVLLGPELPVADLSDAVAGSYLLGVGKSSSAFRIVRQKLGISYRQEANLVLTEKGFRVAFSYSSSSSTDAGKVALDVKQALLDDVGSWTQADFDRSIALCQGPVRLGLIPTPIMAMTDRPLRMSLEDQTLWAAVLSSHPYFKGVVQPGDAAKTLMIEPSLKIQNIKRVIGNSLKESNVKIVDGP